MKLKGHALLEICPLIVTDLIKNIAGALSMKFNICNADRLQRNRTFGQGAPRGIRFQKQTYTRWESATGKAEAEAMSDDKKLLFWSSMPSAEYPPAGMHVRMKGCAPRTYAVSLLHSLFEMRRYLSSDRLSDRPDSAKLSGRVVVM